MNPEPPLYLAASFALGLAGSVHCFAMCGPLACAARGAGVDGRWRRAWAYQGARVVAYATVGLILGATGGGAARVVSLPIERALPWVLVGLLLLSALDPIAHLRRLPAVAGSAEIVAWAARLRARLSPVGQAAILGAITPLLPCGLLYGIAVGALASGSALRGGLVMGSFAFAAIPALVAAQWGMERLGRLTPRWGRRLVPLMAAAVLIVRALRAAAHASCH